MRQIAATRRRGRLLQQITSNWFEFVRQNKREQPCRSSSADDVTGRRDVSHSVSRPLRVGASACNHEVTASTSSQLSAR